MPLSMLPLALFVSVQTHLIARVSAVREQDRERGDVPGWVLITLMTAGIVTVLWRFAGPRLLEIFSNAIDSVQGPA